MAVKVTLWHNPRCSKSRAALALLQARGVAPQLRLYLRDAPDLGELMRVQKLLGLPAGAMIRSNDADFRALGLRKDMPDADLLAAMAAHPALIERPIVITPARAAIGRPPEAVLDIL